MSSNNHDTNAAFPMMSMGGIHEHQFFQTGLSKRELFAAMVMQGFAADTNEGAQPEVIASYAVRYADALLAELAKEPQP
jgi:hypothetical protein